MNDANRIEVDYFDIVYTTLTAYTVTYNSANIIFPPGAGYAPLGTVHLDVVARSTNLAPYNMPNCDNFFLTYDVGDLSSQPDLVMVSYGNLNTYTATVAGPQSVAGSALPACFGMEIWQPDVAGIEQETFPGSGVFYDKACLTYVMGRSPATGSCTPYFHSYYLYYSEWRPLLPGAVCGNKLANYRTLDGTNTLTCTSSPLAPNYSHPRIDAVDDYSTNAVACYAKVVSEARDWAYTGTEAIAYGAPGPTTPTPTSWINVSTLEFPIGSGSYPFPAPADNHFAPAVAYGGGVSDYMVNECTKVPGSGDFFIMSPLGSGCSAGISGANYYVLNSVYPATSSNSGNAVSTSVNNVNDTSLVAWTHGGNIYYKRSGYGYAFKSGQTSPGRSLSDQLTVFPNPAENQITVSMPPSVAANRYTIKNMLGQIIVDGRVTVGDQVINVNHLTNGSYIISFYGDVTPKGNKMFVKK